ncbi:hypothetical protein, partial [Schlesneria sp.]|uniref:hypothetical protein n=1 Tax=Schlesneria sp. TaxID=2762018 RepID=UPI002EED734A
MGRRRSRKLNNTQQTQVVASPLPPKAPSSPIRQWMENAVALSIAINVVSGFERAVYIVILVMITTIGWRIWERHPGCFTFDFRKNRSLASWGMVFLLVCSTTLAGTYWIVERRISLKTTAELEQKQKNDDANETIRTTKRQNEQLNAAVKVLKDQNTQLAKQNAETQNLVKATSSTQTLISDEEAKGYQRRFPMGCRVYSLYQPYGSPVKFREAKTSVSAYEDKEGLNNF